MKTLTRASSLALAALIAVPAATSVSAQDMGTEQQRIDVYADRLTDLTGLERGPNIEGIIVARNGAQVTVAQADGTRADVSIAPVTDIQVRSGFLGIGREKLDHTALMNGLPVKIETVSYSGGLVASTVRFGSDDLATVGRIHAATGQRFDAAEVAIEENAAATEALRGRFGDIDQYNVKSSTSVYFDTGKSNLTGGSQAQLCQAAQQAAGMDNALLLVVGYTDSTGDQDFNQELSEKRAGRVVNYLQQECDWQPWRMLTPTGMAESDPLADNTTAAGRAQNRRVTVHVLVSKAVDQG